MPKEIRKSDIEELIDFLRGHPNCGKFLPSILKAYGTIRKRTEECNLPKDEILSQIRSILSDNFVADENFLMELLNLTQAEVRSRIKYLESHYSEYFSVDRLEKNSWVLYLTKEGLIND